MTSEGRPVGSTKTAEVEATKPAGAKEVAHALRRDPFWVRALRRYVFIYLFIVVIGLGLDALLRSQLNRQQRDVLKLLAWGSTALYAVALVVLLVTFSARLGLGHHRSKSIWVLFIGLAALLVARGYFSVSLLEPSIPQGRLSVAMSDLGLFGGTVIVLGMIWGVVDVAVYAARQAEQQARKVALPQIARLWQGWRSRGRGDAAK